MRNLRLYFALAAALLLAASSASAQSREEREEAEKAKWPTRIFQLKYADVDRLRGVLSGVFRGDFRSDDRLKTLAVRAPQEIMPAIEEAVKKLDVPPPLTRNIELTAYLLGAEQADTNVKLPAELQPVIKQLKSTFPQYEGYRLLETLVLRTRENSEAEAHGMSPSGREGLPPSMYNLKFRSARINADEKGRVVSLVGMRLGARVPVPIGPNKESFNFHDTGIVSDVDIREGQKVVVGKANLQGPDKALFLVLAAKVID